MESEVVRKNGHKMKTSFYSLPKELHTVIFKKLNGKSISTSMCVSHTWRDIILNTTIPETPQHYFLTIRWSPHPFVDLERLFMWCSRVMRCQVSPKMMIGSCNGLLLFCHKGGEVENLRRGAYHYYVINHVTKQCFSVLKPTRTTSEGYSYAALAYDPSESWFFKIMRFLGCHHVSIFSSRSGHWETLTLNLPQEVTKARWVKKTVYAKGAIYRLSRSGHIMKFMVDRQSTVDQQAIALPLPPASLLKGCHWDINVRCGKLLFSMSLGAYFFVFELLESDERGVISYKWVRIRSINDQNLQSLNFYGKLLAYYPYHGIAVFKRRALLHCYHINGNESCDIDGNEDVGPHRIRYNRMIYDYLKDCGLPLFECSINFSCTLDIERRRVFRWLPIPE